MASSLCLRGRRGPLRPAPSYRGGYGLCPVSRKVAAPRHHWPRRRVNWHYTSSAAWLWPGCLRRCCNRWRTDCLGGWGRIRAESWATGRAAACCRPRALGWGRGAADRRVFCRGSRASRTNRGAARLVGGIWLVHRDRRRRIDCFRLFDANRRPVNRYHLLLCKSACSDDAWMAAFQRGRYLAHDRGDNRHRHGRLPYRIDEV